jgi:uncharacterized protein YecE (DUF72 family)
MPPHQKPKTENRKLYLGPAGWDYPDWQGVVYPPGLKGTDRLTFLATLFTAMEINVTFYRPIPADYARRWLEAVADFPDFRFTARSGRSSPATPLAGGRSGPVQTGLAPLLTAGKLGVLLAQFPYSFTTPRKIAPICCSSKPPYRTFPWPWRCATAPGSSGLCGSF